MILRQVHLRLAAVLTLVCTFAAFSIAQVTVTKTVSSAPTLDPLTGNVNMTYTVTMTNPGPDQINVTDLSGTITVAGMNNGVTGDGIWGPLTGTLEAGEMITMEFPVEVACPIEPATATCAVTAATYEAIGISEPQEADLPPPATTADFGLIPPTLPISKTTSGNGYNQNDSYTIKYGTRSCNDGDVPINDFVIQDSLTGMNYPDDLNELGGMDGCIIAPPGGASTFTAVGPGPTPMINRLWDGQTDPNLIMPMTLAPGQCVQVNYVVKIDANCLGDDFPATLANGQCLENNAIAVGNSSCDAYYNPSTNDPDLNPLNNDQTGEPTVACLYPIDGVLGAAKGISAIDGPGDLAAYTPTVRKDGKWNFKYSFVLRNYGGDGNNEPITAMMAPDNIAGNVFFGDVPFVIDSFLNPGAVTLRHDPAYAGTGDILIAGQTLDVGESDTICMYFTVGPFAGFHNTSSTRTNQYTASGMTETIMDGNQGQIRPVSDVSTSGLDPDPFTDSGVASNCEGPAEDCAGTRVTFGYNCDIDLIKEVDDVVQISNEQYNVTYKYTVSTESDVYLDNLSLVDNFAATFGPSFCGVIDLPTVDDGTASIAPLPNMGFTGMGNNDLLMGSDMDSLNCGESFCVFVTVCLDALPGPDPVPNTATVTAMDPADVNVMDTDDAEVAVPLLEVEKSFTGLDDPSLENPGYPNADIQYTVVYTNVGSDTLCNPQMLDTLFPGVVGVNDVAITGSTLILAGGAPAPNTAYDGDGNDSLFANPAGFKILPGGTVTVTIDLTIDLSMTPLPIENTVIGSGTGSSNPGTNLDTTSAIAPIPRVRVIKEFVEFSPPPATAPAGSVTATFRFKAKNNGNVPLSMFSLVEDLAADYNSLYPGTFVSPQPATYPIVTPIYLPATTPPIAVNGTYAGEGGVVPGGPGDMLDAMGILYVCDSVVLEVSYVLNSTGPPPGEYIYNQATASGTPFDTSTMMPFEDPNNVDNPYPPNATSDDSDDTTDEPMPDPEGENPDADNNGSNDSDGNAEFTNDSTRIILPVPVIEVTKEVTSVIETDVEGIYKVMFEIEVFNNSVLDDLDSFEVIDDLAAVLGDVFVRTCDPVIDMMDPVAITTAATLGGNIMENPDYGMGGDWDFTLTTPPDTLLLSDSITFSLCVVVDPDANAMLDSNTVTAIGQSTLSGIMVADTAVIPFEIPSIQLAKFVDPTMPPTENADDPNNFDVSFCWVVTNNGNVPIDSITLIDDFGFHGPAFTGNIITPPAVTMTSGPAIAANSAWNPTMGMNDIILPMPPGDVMESAASFTVCSRVVIDPSLAPMGDTLFNIASATGMDEEGNEVQDSSDNGMEPEGPDYEDPTPLLLPQIALAKFIDPATPPVYPAASGKQGNVDVTFCFTVENTGNVPLDSIVLFEDFGMYGAAVEGVTTPPSIFANNSDLVNLAPNLTWDPLAGMFDLIEPTTMFAAGDTLQPNDNFTICATIEINLNANLPDFDSLLNQAVTMGTDPNDMDVEDESDNGMDPDSSNMMGGFDDPTPFAFPAIGLAKNIVSSELLGPPDFPVANFAVTYEFVIENIGNVPLDSLQLCDDVNAQYGLPGSPTGPFVSVLEQPMIIQSDADMDPVLTGTYDGGITPAGACMFDGMSGAMIPGQTVTIQMTLQINPNAMATPDEPLLNFGLVTGRDSMGTEVMDTSDSGTDAEEDNMEGGFDDPTELILFDINIAKTISNWTPNTNPWEPGHGEATFVMNVKNKGNTPVADVAVVDDIMAMYGPLFVRVIDPPMVTVIDNPGGFADPVVSAMGMTNPDYLSGPGQDTVWAADTIRANVTVSIEFTLELNPNAPGRPDPALNQASVAATDTFGNILMDESDTGTDPEDINEGEVGDTGGEDDPTVGLFPSINLAKTIDTVAIPGQYDPHGFPTTNPSTKIIVDHIHRIKNTSNLTLDSIRLSEPVGDPLWYGMYGAFVEIVGTPEILSAPATGMFMVDPTFDGLAQPEVLVPNPNMDGSDSLQVDEEIVIRIRVLIDVKFVPLDSILFNQSVTTGRGVFPDGMLGDVSDLSDSGTEAESENPDDRLRNALDLPNTGHDDPTPLPNCFDCRVNCVNSLSSSFDENCEFLVDNETIKSALPGLNPICVDLGFYDFRLENEQGGKSANPFRGDQTKDEECRKFIPFNRLCPNVTCWTLLCVKRIDMPIIRGTKYTVYCDDPLAIAPVDGDMPVALISCEGEALTEFIADWADVRECVPGNDTIKIIYREYAATSRSGVRGIGFDTICVLQLPEITTANTYCTERDTLYCGEGGPVGPYLIVDDLRPTAGEMANADACDTIFFVDHVEGRYEARTLGPKCGILTHVESHNFGDSLCEQIYKISVEIKQTCFGEATVACPVPTNPANMLEQIGDNYWKCEFWVVDLDTLAPKIACKLDDYEDDNLLWPALQDLAAGQGLPANVHCYDTPIHPGSVVNAPVILAPSSTHDCAAHTYLPPVCVYEDWSGIKMVKASIEGIGSWVLDAGDSCFIAADSVTGVCYQYHEPVHLPKSDYPYQIKYEAFDDCHNSEITYCYILVKDRTKPVVVVDKGVTVSLSDKKVWVNAETFDEGSWDNCSDPMIYVRRADWYESCIDLCYNVKDGQCDLHAPEKQAAYEICYIGEHHDTLWTTTLEDKKECDEVEAHYSKTLAWLANDGVPCGKLLYNAWQYDLIRYATSECRTHPYDLDPAALHKLIIEATEHNGFSSKFACPEMHDFCDLFSDNGLYQIGDCSMTHDAIVSEMDMYRQIGGGWSDAVAFDCEDACGMVTVEVLAIDYWCNWSKAWMDVWVEDKTPVEVVQDVVDGNISCKTYRTKDYSYPGEQHPVSIEYIVEQAKAGEDAAFGRLDDLFGGYQKAWRDDHGNYVDTSWTVIEDDIEFADSTCICETKVERVKKYDEHFGYIWQDSIYEECRYDTLYTDFKEGIVLVNCLENVQCEQEVWCDIDHCGEGYLFRKFRFWQGCPADSEAHSPHAVDTITRHQRIYIGNSCDLNLAMFDLPEDVTVEACGVEFDPEGSGNIVGDAGPENTGMPVYTFDDDCRIVGIAREDKPFKVVGGDEGCYKIIRTWYLADWCGGKPDNPYWYQDRDLVLDTFVQKILVIDTEAPVCEITTDMVAESGDGTAASPAVFAAQGGCYLTIQTAVEVSDPCGLIDLYWELKDVTTGTVASSGSAALEGDTLEMAAISIADVGPGSYKLQVQVRDECQNESYCEYYLDVVSGKKPGPVCVTTLTAELQPWDTDQDGVVDTAASVIWATEFESSSLPACGEDYEDLIFGIEWADESTEMFDSNLVADSLAIGCDRIGTHVARMWVVSPTGSADYCDVLVVVQDNNGACADASGRAYVGGTNVNDTEAQLVLGFELHQNRPNPFKGETAISFNLPASERATLTIYDATGRMLHQIERVFDKGYNSVEVKLNELAAQGILYYQLDTREFTATRKMTMIN